MIPVFMIDTIGEHRGMHYYNFPLAAELQKLNVQVTLISTIETANHLMRPESVTVLPGFTNIYGDAPKLVRGSRYGLSLMRIGQWIKRDRPHIIHFHFSQIPIFDYLFFTFLEKYSIHRVITVHDVVPFTYGPNVQVARHSFLHKMYQKASGLILNSTYSMQKLAELDPNLMPKARLIQPGAYAHMPLQTLSSAEAKKALGLEHNAKMLLVFGTIKQNKRLDLAIEATAQLANSIPDLRLLIVGQLQGRNVSSEIALTKSLGISTNVIWNLKKVNDEEMKLLFSAADIVIFPYKWIYQSAALLMALSSGKAVVATAVGSNQDTIVDGKTGLLVSAIDARETAVAIEKLIANPQYAHQIAEAAQQDVLKRFTWEKIADETKQFYRHLLQ